MYLLYAWFRAVKSDTHTVRAGVDGPSIVADAAAKTGYLSVTSRISLCSTSVVSL